MKRIIAFMMSLLMIFSLMPATVYAEENCKHVVSSYNSIGPDQHYGECDICLEEVYEDHKYVNGRCTKCGTCRVHTLGCYEIRNEDKHNVYCSICENYIKEEAHQYENGKCRKCGKCKEHTVTYSSYGKFEHRGKCDICGIETELEDHVYKKGRCAKCGSCEVHGNYRYAVNLDIDTYSDYRPHFIVCGICNETVEYEEHNYANGKCTKCGACETHTGEKYRTCCYEDHFVNCSKCNEFIGRKIHDFQNGRCTKCGYCENHTEGKYIYENANSHIVSCIDCGVFIKYERHEYVKGQCKQCNFVCKHSMGTWTEKEKATVLKKGTKIRKCSRCDYEEKDSIDKLKATIKVNTKSIQLKTGQSTTAVKVTMGKGDRIVSWKSNKTSVAKVSQNGKITAQKKAGKAEITVTLASGKTAKITVNVQKKAVTTSKLTVNKKKVTLKKGKNFQLTAKVTPITSGDKITFASSNKKIATVSNKGVIKAKKKGKATITVKSGKKSVKVTVTVK